MRLLSNTIIFYYDFEVNESEKLRKGQKPQQLQQLSGRLLEAARKGTPAGAGSRKEKGV
jgi:hypothetical protein